MVEMVSSFRTLATGYSTLIIETTLHQNSTELSTELDERLIFTYFFLILHHLYLSRQLSSNLILFWIGNHKKFCLAFKRISFKTQILFQGYFYIFPLRIPNHNWEFIYFRLMALCIQFHHTFLGLCKRELKKVLKWINLIQLLIWNWSYPNTNHHFEQCRM